MTDMDYELAVIGAGCAGYSAGIYAGRSGIKTVIFDEGMGGGLSNEAPMIENYPGFNSISGIELMEKMKGQAEKYVDLHFNEEVKKLEKDGEKIKIETSKGNYTAGVIIICTGTEHRRLEVKNEEKLRGRGVSYCATCDGFFFKNKKVVVVGGGSGALIEALYLHQIGCEVSLIHRRDRLRAEETLKREAKKGIDIILNSIIEEIVGKEKVDGIKIKNARNNETSILKVDGIFVSIGEIPKTGLAEQLGVSMDERGYIITDDKQRTNVKRVYAAGDVTGGIRQIVTACAEGATAALASMEVLGKKYPY